MATTFPWRATEARGDRQMSLPLPGVSAGRPRVDTGYYLYVLLHLAGFVVTTLLMTWGVFVLFFLAIGSFSLDLTMNQLDNLTSRYLAADPARVTQFKLIMGCVHLAVSTTIIFFRRRAMFPRDAKAGSTIND